MSAQELAENFAQMAADAARGATEAQIAIDVYRQSMHESEARRDAAMASKKEAEQNAADLVKAIAWVDTGILREGGRDECYYTAFARGGYRLTTGYSSSRHASKAEAWVYHGPANREREEWSAPQGTKDETKQKAQLVQASVWLRDTLAKYTAGAWLHEHGIDHNTVPKLADLLTAESDFHWGWYGDTSYLYPKWRVSLAGAQLAEYNDPHQLAAPGEDDKIVMPGRPNASHEIRNRPSDADRAAAEADMLAWARLHEARAVAAYIRSISPTKGE